MNRGLVGALVVGGAAVMIGTAVALTGRRHGGAFGDFRVKADEPYNGRLIKGHFKFLPERGKQYWQDANWAWFRKNSKPEELEIVVTAWPKHDAGPDDGLRQEFTADSAAAARTYARKLVADGTAVAADVRLLVRQRAWSPTQPAAWKTVESQSFRREDG
jgi:hypothetical protein